MKRSAANKPAGLQMLQTLVPPRILQYHRRSASVLMLEKIPTPYSVNAADAADRLIKCDLQSKLGSTVIDSLTGAVALAVEPMQTPGHCIQPIACSASACTSRTSVARSRPSSPVATSKVTCSCGSR